MDKTAEKMVNLLVSILRLYQILLSPLLGNRCRFYPSCSNYFIATLKAYGLLHGMGLAVRRVLKCHSLGAGGYDPPPTCFSD